jgi:predicted metal-dependent hydrolase
MPVIVVPTSAATVAIDTFMTDVSRIIRNWARARTISTPPAVAAAGIDELLWGLETFVVTVVIVGGGAPASIANVTALPAYSVRRSSRARRSRLTITDQGQAVVVLPARAPESDAAELVIRHRRWVERHTSEIQSRRLALAARPALGHGRTVPLHGVEHVVFDMTSLRGRRTTLSVADGPAIVISRASSDGRPTAAILEAWLRERAREVIGDLLGRRAVEMDIEVERMAIRDQRTRWGSASRRGTLSFSWRLVMAPIEVLDYVVVHELAHLRATGHGRAFWRLVDGYFPDSAAARRWLRENQHAMRHALT